MTYYQPVIQNPVENVTFHCAEIFEDKDEAVLHGTDVAEKMISPESERYTVNAKILISNQNE